MTGSAPCPRLEQSPTHWVEIASEAKQSRAVCERPEATWIASTYAIRASDRARWLGLPYNRIR
jgi:hypothetical protein